MAENTYNKNWKNALIVAFSLLVLGVLIFFTLSRNSERYLDIGKEPNDISTPTSSFVNQLPDWEVYQSSGSHFSIAYPKSYLVDELYTYSDLGPGKDIMGISFTIPSASTTGTNLSKDTYVSVEILPKNEICQTRDFLTNVTGEETVTEGNRVYMVAHGGGAGAGNFYDETISVTEGGNYCYGLRLFIHSTNIYNYDPGTIREFDKNELEKVYEEMRKSFVLDINNSQ